MIRWLRAPARGGALAVLSAVLLYLAGDLATRGIDLDGLVYANIGKLLASGHGELSGLPFYFADEVDRPGESSQQQVANSRCPRSRAGAFDEAVVEALVVRWQAEHDESSLSTESHRHAVSWLTPQPLGGSRRRYGQHGDRGKRGS